MSSTTPKPKPKPAQSGFVRQYLLAYNAVNFYFWITLTIRTTRLLINQAVTEKTLTNFDIPAIFSETYSPLLQLAQSLAVLEILHSLVGIVRAPFVTTAMQVASRLFVVWGVLFPFHESIMGAGDVGVYGYLGCLFAWGVTECIRYGFFVMQVNGGVETVPAWWQWLRYNTFYILYPIGISSECTLAVKALSAADQLHPLYWWFIVAVLAVYVPGSYVMYSHMIKQKRKTAGAKKDGKKE
ncbi:tyrosine phosphatase-like protein [Aspergillus varians]